MSQPGWMEASHWPAAAGWTAVAVANGAGREHLTGRILRRITGARGTRGPWRQAYHRTELMSTADGPRRRAASFIRPLPAPAIHLAAGQFRHSIGQRGQGMKPLVRRAEQVDLQDLVDLSRGPLAEHAAAPAGRLGSGDGQPP